METTRNGGAKDYSDRLGALIGLVDRCTQSTDPPHCDSKRVGEDDRFRLQTPHGIVERPISYDWLRDALTLAVAAKKAEAANKPPADKKPVDSTTNKSKTTGKVPTGDAAPANNEDEDTAGDDSTIPGQVTSGSLLSDARTRLVADQQALQRISRQGIPANPDHAAQRKQITAILSQQEFDQIEHPSAWDRAVEAFENWLNNLFGRLPTRGSSKWVLWTFEWGLVSAAATGLAWWLIQGSRREQWRLESAGGPRAGAPSLRDWRVWVADAEALAAAGKWREAVHMVYWAAISRLESRGSWPVDRARTPREYLGLISAADPRRDDLASLTRGFERIWYGYRSAAELEYRNALQLLEKLAAR